MYVTKCFTNDLNMKLIFFVTIFFGLTSCADDDCQNSFIDWFINDDLNRNQHIIDDGLNSLDSSKSVIPYWDSVVSAESIPARMELDEKLKNDSLRWDRKP